MACPVDHCRQPQKHTPPPLIRSRMPPHHLPHAVLERAPAPDALWLGGHPPPNGTDHRPRHPGATVQAPIPPQAALREPQLLWRSDRPDRAPPSNAVNRPCGPTNHDLPPRGPRVAHHRRGRHHLTAPPLSERRVSDACEPCRRIKYPKRFPLCTPQPKYLASAVGPLSR